MDTYFIELSHNTYYSATFGKWTIDFNTDILWNKVNTEYEIDKTCQEQEKPYSELDKQRRE